jgi:hypothetical protein
MTILTIGKRLISLEQIAYVEAFDPAANPEFKPEKDFKARLVLLNRDAVLTENSPEEFSEANGFHVLAEDNIAVKTSFDFAISLARRIQLYEGATRYLYYLRTYQ